MGGSQQARAGCAPHNRPANLDADANRTARHELRPPRQRRHPARRPRCRYRHSAGKIAAIEPKIDAEAGRVIDATGDLVSPPFVDPHFHMDATLSYGLPRINASGTLLEGIALWGELKPLLTHEAVRERALAYCDWAVSMGLLAIRTPCRRLRRPAARRRGAARGEEAGRALYRPAARRLPAGRLLPLADGARRTLDARARHGRRRGRRHPAFRAHHGGRPRAR